MTYTNTNKRDGNEREIVEALKAAGCVWIQAKPGQGFDGLLIAPNGLHIIEIKNPATSWELTEKELQLLHDCRDRRVPYNVVQTVEGALKLIGS